MHLDLPRRSGLVEAVWQQAIVLDVARAGEQPGGHPVLNVHHDRLVNLHLAGAVDGVVVGFEPAAVFVVVVARYGTVRLHRARLEQGIARRIRHRDVQPGAPGRIGGRQLVPGKALHRHAEFQRGSGHARRVDANPGSLGFEELPRAALGRFQLLGQGRHAEFGAVLVEDPQHEGIAAPEHVLVDRRPQLAQHRGDGRVLDQFGHVTALATVGGPVVAVQPLVIWHLLGQHTHFLARVIERFGEQRVAGGAQLGFRQVLAGGRHEIGRRIHQGLAADIHFVGAVYLTLAHCQCRVDDETAGEAGIVAEVVVLDLVAHRTGDPVRRQGIVPGREIGENLAGGAAVVGRVKARHGHVTGRAGVLDGRLGLGMVHDLAPHARLPVGVLCGVGHHGGPPRITDGDILSFR